MQTVTIKGQKRQDIDKKATKASRKEGLVPCVLYGGKENLHFTVPALELRDIVYTSQFKLANIEVDGATHQAILKDVQMHPVTDNLLHIDFLELVEGQPFKAQVPVKVFGVSEGVKAGGKLIRRMRSIRIKTTPEHMLENLELSIEGLELGESRRVRDLVAVEGVEIMDAGANPVVTVEVPRAMRSAASQEAAAAPAASAAAE